MSSPAGITGRGRAELAAVLASGGRFVTPADVASALGIDADLAAKRLARWAEELPALGLKQDCICSSPWPSTAARSTSRARPAAPWTSRRCTCGQPAPGLRGEL